jgi:hypothetical protein
MVKVAPSGVIGCRGEIVGIRTLAALMVRNPSDMGTQAGCVRRSFADVVGRQAIGMVRAVHVSSRKSSKRIQTGEPREIDVSSLRFMAAPVQHSNSPASPPISTATYALGALLLKAGAGYTLAGATCFALGSTLYSYLFLSARNIPVLLAWLGVLASVLLVVGLPLQLAGFLSGPLTNFMWIPMAVYEVALALWLLIKGVATTPQRISPRVGDVTA